MDVNRHEAPSEPLVSQGPPNTHVLLGGAERNSLGVRAGRMPLSCPSGEIPGAPHRAPSVTQSPARWHFLEHLQVLCTLPSLWIEAPPQARAGVGGPGVSREGGQRDRSVRRAVPQMGPEAAAASCPAPPLRPVSIQPHVRVARFVRGGPWLVFPEPEL